MLLRTVQGAPIDLQRAVVVTSYFSPSSTPYAACARVGLQRVRRAALQVHMPVLQCDSMHIRML